MKQNQASQFLDRRSYRQRRMMDALRLLPFLALLLWFLPLFWPTGGSREDPVGMSVAVTYVFSVWFLMILAAFVLSRFLRKRLIAEIETNQTLQED